MLCNEEMKQATFWGSLKCMRGERLKAESGLSNRYCLHNIMATALSRTGCSFISGYQKDVEYIASTAFDLIYFELLQQYTSLRKVKRIIADRYSLLTESLSVFY